MVDEPSHGHPLMDRITALKLVLACALCIGVVAGLVFLVQHLLGS